MKVLTRDKSQTPRMIRTCSIWRALDVLGDVPTLMVLQAIWLREHRFGEIESRTRLTRALLSDRLRRLIRAEVVMKGDARSGAAHQEYRLTAKGADLFWVTLMLLRWEQNWCETHKTFRVALIHKSCRAELVPVPQCGACHQPFDAHTVSWAEGPGLGLMTPRYHRRRQRRDRTESSRNELLFTDAAELLGDRWASLILRSIFTGLRRYDEILEDTAMATNILSERLAWLVEFGVLEPTPVGDAAKRLEYRLSEKGVDYYPILVTLQLWGDKYYASPEGPPILLQHKECRHALDPKVACMTCGEAVLPGDVEVHQSLR